VVGLAKMLAVNTSLIYLGLSRNIIGEKGLKALANVIENDNRTLQILGMYDTVLDENIVKQYLKPAVAKNGMILYITLTIGVGIIQPFLDRNRRAHQHARRAVLQLLKIAQIPTKDLKVGDETKVTEGLSKLAFQSGGDFRKSYFARMAYELWKTRADPSWWTTGEKQLESSTKRSKIESCIACTSPNPKFCEQGAPSRRFCGSYCQWIKHTGAPDLRGKTSEQIKSLLLF
jgi:hypothetical protein